MALASLRFQRNAQDYEESRQGMTVFAGDAASFHEWQFRLQIKNPALTAKVVDALRGEALSCAMEIGLAKLMEANGLDLLVQKVQERLFPQRTAEARELLKQGMRFGGPMSRVPGEPMTSYISRRRRWWTLVHEMDNTLELGDTVRGSMMLEQAGLSRFEQNMVLTYTKGQRTMEPCSNSTTTYTIVGVRHPRQQEIHLLPIVGDVVTRPVPIWQKLNPSRN